MIYKSLFVNIEGGIYNAGTGIKTSMLEQIEGIIKVFSPENLSSLILPRNLYHLPFFNNPVILFNSSSPLINILAYKLSV